MKKNMSFEESLLRLEQIVKTMENGEISLEESLKLFQEGTELSSKCSQILENAKLQVTTIFPKSDGSPKEEKYLDEI